jgi:hypothetical protein
MAAFVPQVSETLPSDANATRAIGKKRRADFKKSNRLTCYDLRD